jgi:hypothetical protein
MPSISPILEHIVMYDLANPQYEAHWGYLNRDGVEQDVAIGPSNKFTPAPESRGQPTHFLRAPDTNGRVRDAFSTPFSGGNLVWTLAGRTATAGIPFPAGQGPLAYVGCSRIFRVGDIEGLLVPTLLVRFFVKNTARNTIKVPYGPANTLTLPPGSQQRGGDRTVDGIGQDTFPPGDNLMFAITCPLNADGSAPEVSWQLLGRTARSNTGEPVCDGTIA